jgi:ATP-dependent Clp protease ATP-binding subunit ClpB
MQKELQDALAERLLAGEIVDGSTVQVSAEGAALTLDGKPTHPVKPILRTVGNA